MSIRGVAFGLLTAVAISGVSFAGTSEPRAADLLSRYLRIESDAGSSGEAQAAEYLATLLRSAGLSAARYVSPDGHSCLLSRLPANAAREGGAVLLLHHFDVVPPGEGWSVAPFGGTVRDGAVWGRGAIDAKGLGIAHLTAFLAAARDPAPRARDLVFLAVGGEESGGEGGTGWLLAAHPRLLADVALVLNEGGLNRSSQGRVLWWGLEIASKRPLWLELISRGRGGHGSMVAPASPTHELVRALARIVDRPLGWRLEAPALASLQAQARLDPGLAATLERLPELLASGQAEHSLPPSILGLLSDTIQVTTLSAADSVNVIATEARARIDARLLPSTDERAFLAEIEQLAGKRIEIHILLTSPRVASSPFDSDDVRTLADSLRAEATVIPAFISGVTDSRFFRQHGIASYGFSPYALDATLLTTIHGADERMPTAELERGIERMRRAVRALIAPRDGRSPTPSQQGAPRP